MRRSLHQHPPRACCQQALHVLRIHLRHLGMLTQCFDAETITANPPSDSAANKPAAAQVGVLAQKAGYVTLDMEGLATPAQWAAAAAAAVRNAAALENAMLQVILAATAVKLVARPAFCSQALHSCMGPHASYRQPFISVSVCLLSVTEKHVLSSMGGNFQPAGKPSSPCASCPIIRPSCPIAASF